MLIFFFFHHTATTEIYTLSLHDALPILHVPSLRRGEERTLLVIPYFHIYGFTVGLISCAWLGAQQIDRKSTRLNSSHVEISYAVFCLKKKKKNSHTVSIKQVYVILADYC